MCIVSTRTISCAGLAISLAAAVPFAAAAPVLPDWTTATFNGASASITNQYFPHPQGLYSVHEGIEDGAVERIQTLSSFSTTSILGVENRVIVDSAYLDGVLVEVAHDWYAQDSAGNVWYFGESVVNYRYDDGGNFLGTDNDGSWIADGITSFPGLIMAASPQVGDEYFQEFAPGVAFDFAVINSTTDMLNIGLGSYSNVVHTSEGNLFDGPELAENKLYAPGVGLVLIQSLDDDGNPESNIELIHQELVPAPSVPAVLALALITPRRRRPAA